MTTCSKEHMTMEGDRDMSNVSNHTDGDDRTTVDEQAKLYNQTAENNTGNEIKPKRPPRSERKRRRHEELLLKRKEERKRKKQERKERIREEREETGEEKNADDIINRRKTQELKEARRQRCREAMVNGQRIVIDCSLEQYMSYKEKGKLVMQINRLYGSNLRADNPAHIYLSGMKHGGQLHQECVRKMDGFENYLVDTKQESHTELFPLDQIVYLSPDSSNLLTDIDPDKIYVIGGLVDENIKQNVTQTRATEHGVTTARLPIEENMTKIEQQSHSKILAVNQVFDILMKFKETKDWKQALSIGVPRRKGYIIKDNSNT